MLRKSLKVSLAGLLVVVVFITGCENQAQNNALLGAGLGVGISAITGGEGRDLATGAAIGAVAGYILTDKESSQQQPQQRTPSSQVQQDTVSVWITNSNGSQYEVKLRPNGKGGYYGPKGELYPTMPTQEQLKGAYGF